MFSLLAIAALVVAALANPIVPKNRPIFSDGRIIGGENAVIKTYPYQISLEFDGSHNCGGSIISANYIVTAGHCTLTGDISNYTVRVGSSFREQGGSVHEVDKIVRHDKYYNDGFASHFDVAVLKVKEPFVFDETRQPIKLFDASEESLSGADSVITGWGENGKGSSFQLRVTVTPIVPKDICVAAYKKMNLHVSEDQICSGYYGVGGKGHCIGNSGGPLTIDGRQAGIVSWSNGCAGADYPSVFTEVAYFREWINEHATL